MQIDVFLLLPLDIYHTKRTDSVLEKAPSSPTLTTAPRTDRESHGFHSLHLNETSKTELGRVICVRGTSRGPAKVQLERALREYWLAADFPMADTVLENGWSIERPDWWVVQIPVHALRFDQAMRRRLEEWLSASKVGRVAENAKALKGDIARLVEGKDPKESKQFINVVGGSLGGPALDSRGAHGYRRSLLHRKGSAIDEDKGGEGRPMGRREEGVGGTAHADLGGIDIPTTQQVPRTCIHRDDRRKESGFDEGR